MPRFEDENGKVRTVHNDEYCKVTVHDDPKREVLLGNESKELMEISLFPSRNLWIGFMLPRAAVQRLHDWMGQWLGKEDELQRRYAYQVMLAMAVSKETVYKAPEIAEGHARSYLASLFNEALHTGRFADAGVDDETMQWLAGELHLKLRIPEEQP